MNFPAAKGLHFLAEMVSDWRKKYHVDKKGNIIFQNKGTLANVRFNDNALHKIQPHSKGFENIPATIENPDEIWSYWDDPAKQRVVLRNYIKDGYICQTKDGVLFDAFVVNKNQANKYKKGCLL